MAGERDDEPQASIDFALRRLDSTAVKSNSDFKLWLSSMIRDGYDRYLNEPQAGESFRERVVLLMDRIQLTATRKRSIRERVVLWSARHLPGLGLPARGRLRTIGTPTRTTVKNAPPEALAICPLWPFC